MKILDREISEDSHTDPHTDSHVKKKDLRDIS